jgi:hypothetical protein
VGVSVVRCHNYITMCDALSPRPRFREPPTLILCGGGHADLAQSCSGSSGRYQQALEVTTFAKRDAWLGVDIATPTTWHGEGETLVLQRRKRYKNWRVFERWRGEMRVCMVCGG